ncbi:MAG: leucyl/phenylalanyl-tRNA--protein transferase [Marinilabiliales bacterium]|nr:MAG: leucyl/phenylalanyl-tRNA--protein transferase [Marinilabiliales bacterium]
MDFHSEYVFPDIDQASPEGLLAVGGDLEPATLLEAYSKGVFPWFSQYDPILWWSLDPRMVLFTNEIHLSKSLKRVIRSGKFSVSFDDQFESVIKNCSRSENEDDERWITDEMIEAYIRLHKLGFAHSVEVSMNDRLVGGLYGVSLGRMFFGESMFFRVPDASKVALIALTEKLRSFEINVIDCQQDTDHMRRMGARPIPRSEFKKLLAEAMKYEAVKGNWNNR